jgi:hypothetical protein
VIDSNSIRFVIASWSVLPQTIGQGLNAKQTFGRSGIPNSLHRLRSSSCMQRSPAALPCSIPGIADDILGAMQHAPHPRRQSIIQSFSSGQMPGDGSKLHLIRHRLVVGSLNFTRQRGINPLPF